MSEYTVEGPRYGMSAVCSPILRALPEWFGIEEALASYIKGIDPLPTFVAQNSEGAMGMLSLKLHTPYAAEIYVMGCLRQFHRQGIGRALVQQAEAWLRSQAVEYLQVKTLGPSNPDENYAHTRAFYTALGFRPLEELAQIWDENNPCLILIKRL